jgi:hypothetical protein
MCDDEIDEHANARRDERTAVMIEVYGKALVRAVRQQLDQSSVVEIGANVALERLRDAASRFARSEQTRRIVHDETPLGGHRERFCLTLPSYGALVAKLPLERLSTPGSQNEAS